MTIHFAKIISTFEVAIMRRNALQQKTLIKDRTIRD